jgi:hypothetical protein
MQIVVVGIGLGITVVNDGSIIVDGVIVGIIISAGGLIVIDKVSVGGRVVIIDISKVIIVVVANIDVRSKITPNSVGIIKMRKIIVFTHHDVTRQELVE